jgi:hypothetical protein
MGIAGVSLEARTRPRWDEQLSSEEAVLAASYATLEINGFPSWFAELAVTMPTEVRSVLFGEVAAELADPEPRDRYEVLEDLSRADNPIVELMAPALFEELWRREDLAPSALRPILRVLVRGLSPSSKQRKRRRARQMISNESRYGA